VATHINESVRARENRDAILRLQDMFTANPNFVSPSRSFVRKGSLIKKCRSADKKYEFFLFKCAPAHLTSVHFTSLHFIASAPSLMPLFLWCVHL
jgi:hypothetical protein